MRERLAVVAVGLQPGAAQDMARFEAQKRNV
jgi:hypothetical protein